MIDLDVVVGRGTLLAGRYRLVQPTASDLPGVHVWTAEDLILDRPVRALLLDDGPVGAAQDAARRAALVADPRLVRVLDVGDHEGVPFIATEPLVGRDLAELTATGPLPAQQARAVLGETAAALETARRRGVHHLALRPSAVRVTDDGRVLLSGLALDSELLGTAQVPEEATSRADTVGLVSLLYLTLTGRWPATPGAAPSSVTRAPMVGGSPVAPAELSPGVPNDLDTLCAVTLGPHDDGPRTPLELVHELEPWAPIDVTRPRGTDIAIADAAPASRKVVEPDRPHTAADTDTDAASAGQTPPDRTVRRSPVRTAVAGQAPPASPPGTPPPAIPPTSRLRDPRAPRPGGGATAVPPAEGAPAVGVATTGAPPPAAPRTGAPSTGTRTPASAPASPSADGGPSTDRRPGGTPARRPPASPPPRRPVAPATGTAAVAAPPAAGNRPAPPPAAPAAATPGDPPPAAAAPRGGASPRSVDSFDSIIGRSADVLTRRQFDPTPVVLLVVALAVVVGVALAWRALTAPTPPIGGTEGFGTVSEAVPSAPVEPEEEAEPPAEEQPAPEPEPEPEPVPPVIASAQMIDPPPGGDNNEHPEAVPLAIDGDPATEWYSRTYVSPTYGMKPGIGYAVTLEQPATVSTVTLLVDGAGGNVEVRATDPATPTEGEVLAAGPLEGETVLTLAEPTEAQHIVLWFTELPQTPDGSNRVELAEVRVS